jgi:hypothetical protein
MRSCRPGPPQPPRLWKSHQGESAPKETEELQDAHTRNRRYTVVEVLAKTGLVPWSPCVRQQILSDRSKVASQPCPPFGNVSPWPTSNTSPG